MPPKTKFKKEKIIDIAFEYVRQNGWNGLTVRYLAEKLNSSTMPIYSCFKSMRHLENEVVKRAMDLCFEYLKTPRTGDMWIDHGVGYVLFARNEKFLFRAIFDEEHVAIRIRYDQLIWEELGKGLATYPPFKELSDSQLLGLRRGRWVMMHGLASLINTAQISMTNEHEIRLTVETVSKVLLSGIKENFD